MSATDLKLAPIGNSQGVRIPKPLIEQAGLSGEVQKSRVIRAAIRSGVEA